MSGCRPPPRVRLQPSRGMVLPVLLAAVVAVVLVLAAGWQAAAAGRARAQARQRQEAAFAAARVAVRGWYQDHLAELDTPGGVPPDPSTALAGLPQAATVRVTLGELSTEGEVPGRIVEAWTGMGSTRLDAGPLVDGHALERLALQRARRQLQALAGRFETWFRARVAADPMHLVDRNWYRPADPGCLPERGELPCLPDYADLGAVPAVSEALALAPVALRTPWGPCCPVEASNFTDARQAPPFSLALRIRTPWNVPLRSQAVQAGGQT